MAPGRLSVTRAEIASLQDRWQVAEEAAIQGIEIARAIGREKYETSARIVLGSALLEQGSRRPTVSVILRRDGVRSLDAVGDDGGAADAGQDAVESVTSFVAGMSSEHAASVLGSRDVREIVLRRADVGHTA